MSKIIKIALYGDSLALPRKETVKYNERYFFLIQKWLNDNFNFDYIEIKDRAKGATTITELLSQYEHDAGYFELPGDIIIIQTGIVDCAPRPIDQKTRDKIGRLPSIVKSIIVKYIHKNRRKILQKGNSFVRTSKDLYYNTIKTLMTKAASDYKKVYVVNICPTNSKTEEHSPGFTKNIDEYNSLIKNAIENVSERNIFLIDINKYINEKRSEIDHYVLKEDGHHISALTHKIIAEMLIEHEAKERKKVY